MHFTVTLTQAMNPIQYSYSEMDSNGVLITLSNTRQLSSIKQDIREKMKYRNLSNNMISE
jgi:hypothetical protein